MEIFADFMKNIKESLGTSLGALAIDKLVPALIVLIVAIIVIKLIMKLIDKTIDKLRIDKTLHGFFKATIKILLYAIAVIMVVGTLGIPITSLVAVLSVVGLAVSLAIQTSLANLAGGVTILLTKPFKVDDYIETGDGAGTVLEIGMFHTVLSTPDKKDIFIPNGKIADSKIVNFSKERRRKIVLNFTASYDDDIDKVKAALIDVAKADKRILQDPAPFANVSAYLDSSIEYMFAVWVKNADYWDVYFYIMEAVKHSFDKNGITMTYNHLNVHVVKD